MLETYLAIDEQVKYYECSDFPFNFKLIGMRPAHLRPLSAQTVLNQIHKWLDNTPKAKLANWVVRITKMVCPLRIILGNFSYISQFCIYS